jgi:hypothetical protein
MVDINEEELNQPEYQCPDCKEWVTFPFGIGVVWPGICACVRVIYQWDGHERKLQKCVVDKGWGSRFNWTVIDLAQKR